MGLMTITAVSSDLRTLRPRLLSLSGRTSAKCSVSLEPEERSPSPTTPRTELPRTESITRHKRVNLSSATRKLRKLLRSLSWTRKATRRVSSCTWSSENQDRLPREKKERVLTTLSWTPRTPRTSLRRRRSLFWADPALEITQSCRSELGNQRNSRALWTS